MPSLVSLTGSSLQILGKTGTGVFPISGFLVNHLYKKIVITPEPVMILTLNLDQKLKLTRETKQREKNLTMTSCQKILTSLSFFSVLVNLEQFESRIRDASSLKLTFSLIVTFFLTKTENITKNSLTQLSHFCFE